jgi:glycine betaine/proline transport system substrate-binding protein
VFATSRRGRMVLAGCVAAVLAVVVGCSGKAATVGGTGGDSNSKSVTFSVVQGWDEDIAATYLWKELLERKGYQVNLQQLDIASTFTGLANNQVDAYLDAWLPSTHKSYWDKFGSKITDVGSWYGPADLVLAVPNYVQANSIADLKGQAGQFDGRIVGIEPGAGEMRIARDDVMPAYGLNGEYQLVEGSTPAMLASLDSAIKENKPIVVTLWHPHLAFTKFPIKVLQDPKGAWGKPDELHAVTSQKFSQAKPEVVNWLKKFHLDDHQLGTLEQAIEQKGKGHEQDAVKDWLNQNPQVANSFTS